MIASVFGGLRRLPWATVCVGLLASIAAQAASAADCPGHPDAIGTSRTIVVDPHARVLYLVEDGGQAIRYGIAVGREGRGFRGDATVRRKEAWPGWTPTANMIRNEPDVYGPYAGGLPGGLDNPLGARALYLYVISSEFFRQLFWKFAAQCNTSRARCQGKQLNFTAQHLGKSASSSTLANDESHCLFTNFALRFGIYWTRFSHRFAGADLAWTD